MCGISCIVSLHRQDYQNGNPATAHPPHDPHGSGNAGVSNLAKELDDSLDQIVHRGPDSRGQWISRDKRVGSATSRPSYSEVKHTNLKCSPWPLSSGDQ